MESTGRKLVDTTSLHQWAAVHHGNDEATQRVEVCLDLRHQAVSLRLTGLGANFDPPDAIVETTQTMPVSVVCIRQPGILT